VKKVAVIGAGLSGLTCAYRLSQYGFDVQVFEARKRLGGRVFSLKTDTSFEELGGKNINDGGDAPHMLKLIEQFDLDLTIDHIPFSMKVLDGDNTIDIKELFKGKKLLEGDALEQLKPLIESKKNLGEILKEMFKDEPLLLRYFSLRISCYEGSSIYKLDTGYFYLGFLDVYNQMVEKVTSDNLGMYEMKSITGGNAKLIEALASKLKGKIHTEMVLKKVAFRDQRVQVTLDKNYMFDQVVLAIPGSCLQNIEFEEDVLEDDQYQAIETLQMGTNAKLMIPVKSNPSNEGFAILNSTTTWRNHDKSIITIYFGGKLNPISNKEKAYLEAKKDLSLVFGVEGMSEEIEIVPDNAESTYHHNGSLAMDWNKECYSLGSYSTFAPKTFDFFEQSINLCGERIRKVFRPIQNRLFFAGEFLVFDAQATLEGAVESGEIIAKAINCC